MTKMGFEDGALFELRFWLEVLGDHAKFIRDSLASGEDAEISRAKQFVQAFDSMLDSARMNLDSRGITALLQAVNPWTSQLRAFKLHLLQRSLTGNILISLAPTFLNHMVDELEEGMRVFAALTNGQLPAPGPAVHQHLVWLLDAAGHADILSGEFDMVEKSWKNKSGEFESIFQSLYLKANELAGYMRTSLVDFPALRRFNHEANTVMLLFMKFLSEVKELTADKELLSTLTVLIPDHMYREECYYLKKLSQTAPGVPRPDCDPSKPRATN